MAPCGQVSLGLKLGVALHDQPARDAESRGECSRRRQARLRLEPSGADPHAELFFELNAKRDPRLPVKRDQQLKRGSGPLI
jgi:hypothetical protein